MTTAIDTNVIAAPWQSDPTLSLPAQHSLDAALQIGGLVVCAPVYSELLAFRGRDEVSLDEFFADTGVLIDWNLSESMWRVAGLANQRYAERRRKHGESGPRRILADFLIGAHALDRDYQLLTADDRFYRIAFPRLRVVRV